MSNHPPVIDWSRCANPVLSLPCWSAKDACVIEREGVFHVFTSLFDQERSTIAHLVTRDWCHWSDLLDHWTGDEQGVVGVCSPDLVEVDGRYYLAYNSWGQPSPPDNCLFCRISDDLEHWSDPVPVAEELTAGHRCIDLALAHHAGNWAALWRQGRTTRVAVAPAITGPWRFVDSGAARLLRDDGRDAAVDGVIHENCQMVRLDGVWHLLSTDFDPHEPWLYRLQGDPDDPTSWATWGDGRRLVIPGQIFNTIPADLPCVQADDGGRPMHPCPGDPSRVRIVDGLANAPFLFDRRNRDGYAYLLYAGKNEIGRLQFRGTAAGGQKGFHRNWPRGWNRLALARSSDLVHWHPAGG